MHEFIDILAEWIDHKTQFSVKKFTTSPLVRYGLAFDSTTPALIGQKYI